MLEQYPSSPQCPEADRVWWPLCLSESDLAGKGLKMPDMLGEGHGVQVSYDRFDGSESVSRHSMPLIR